MVEGRRDLKAEHQARTLVHVIFTLREQRSAPSIRNVCVADTHVCQLASDNRAELQLPGHRPLNVLKMSTRRVLWRHLCSQY